MIFEKVKGIILDTLSCAEEAITLEATLTEDLGADSVDLVDLVMAMEEEFEVGEIQEEDLKTLKTVGDAVNYIASKVKS